MLLSLNHKLNKKKLIGLEDIGSMDNNPYSQKRTRKNVDIPVNPYTRQNYEIGANSYLKSNPILNPVDTYEFVDRRPRRVPSGRLQNSGSNIVSK